NLRGVSSLVDTISSAVEDLTTAVGEVSYALTDSVAEQVTSMINGFRPEEEISATEETVNTSESKNTMLPEVSNNTACQKTRSNLEHRAKEINCNNTFASQEQGMHEERSFKHTNDRPQTLSEYQETGNGSDSSLKGYMKNDGISVMKQNTKAGSTCHGLESIDRCKKIGLGISDDDKNDLREVRYQEMKENENTTNGISILYEKKKYIVTDNHKREEYAKFQYAFLGRDQEKIGHFNKSEHLIDLGHSDHSEEAEKHIKGKEFKGNECSPKDILTSNRQKPTMKEDMYPASSTNSKNKFYGKINQQINLTKYHKMKGDIKTKKNEANSSKKGTAKSKVEKYSKIVPEK
ncbi:Hypothetical predicted protein, partial [Marmota monax]